METHFNLHAVLHSTQRLNFGFIPLASLRREILQRLVKKNVLCNEAPPLHGACPLPGEGFIVSREEDRVFEQLVEAVAELKIVHIEKFAHLLDGEDRARCDYSCQIGIDAIRLMGFCIGDPLAIGKGRCEIVQGGGVEIGLETLECGIRNVHFEKVRCSEI